MAATRFLLLLALALAPVGCQTTTDLIALALDKPSNPKPDPNNSYDPYGIVSSAHEDSDDLAPGQPEHED